MSQLTLKKSTAWLRKIHWSDGILVLSFFFTALSFQSAVFLYPGLAFFYQRNRREGLAAAIGTLAADLSDPTAAAEPICLVSDDLRTECAAGQSGDRYSLAAGLGGRRGRRVDLPFYPVGLDVD